MSDDRFRRYPVELEVAGPLAMFARPDTGGTPVSYPAPTWSAAKGIFESIAFFADSSAFFCPTRVDVCRAVATAGGVVNFQSYATSYGGPLRKPDLVTKGNSMQVFATVLSNVCYRMHAVVLGRKTGNGGNARHHLQDLFNRRLKQGRCFRVPRLGWSEFTCSYWGLPRPDVTEVDDALLLEIPSMLRGMWNQPVGGAYGPAFVQGLAINAGELDFGLTDSDFEFLTNAGRYAHAE